MNFLQFLKMNERHLVPMSTENIRTRKERRDYIEQQLYKMGYTFIIDETTKKSIEPEKPQKSQKNDFGVYEPKSFFSRLVNKYKRKKQVDYNNEEFIEFCLMYWGDEPRFMPKDEREEAYAEFLMYNDFDDEGMDVDDILTTKDSTQSYYDPFIVNFYRKSDLKDNIVVFANGFDSNRPTRMLMAHYDVNTESNFHDNANDNGAAIIVLLEFLEERKFRNDKNIIVVFTDGEEFGGQGADSLAKQINKGIHGKVEWVLNLDVVGIGNKVVFENVSNTLVSKIKSIFTDDEIGFISMPPNDALYLRKNNINSVCLTVIPDINWDNEKKVLVGRPKIWSFLHSKEDKWGTIEKEALTVAFSAVNKIMNS